MSLLNFLVYVFRSHVFHQLILIYFKAEKRIHLKIRKFIRWSGFAYPILVT